MKWVKNGPINDGHSTPVVQNYQPFWNDGTEMPAQVTEFLTGRTDFPNYALYLTIGEEENARIVYAGHYYSLGLIEEFLAEWAADQQ